MCIFLFLTHIVDIVFFSFGCCSYLKPKGRNNKNKRDLYSGLSYFFIVTSARASTSSASGPETRRHVYGLLDTHTSEEISDSSDYIVIYIQHFYSIFLLSVEELSFLSLLFLFSSILSIFLVLYSSCCSPLSTSSLLFLCSVYFSLVYLCGRIPQSNLLREPSRKLNLQ